MTGGQGQPQGTDRFIPADRISRLTSALPFWISMLIVPAVLFAAARGGWALILPPLLAWFGFSLLDAVTGLERRNADPDTPEAVLGWYRLITKAWVPLQALILFGLIWFAPRAGHLSGFEQVALFFGVGILTGTIGINFSHELMHRSGRQERWFADILLAMVLYSHFRSEHLLVHHAWVGTPRDAVTARYNEGFHRFFLRVLPQCWRSAFRAEKDRQARAGRRWWNRRNPFWRYWAMQAGFIALAAAISGWVGVGLFAFQALVAIWQLELTNYVEHYGLTRKHLGDGRYEPQRAHHSWNAEHRATNWLLINLQRHADHHIRPDRRFPLLQTYDEDTAPKLPFGYPMMTLAAMVPPIFRRMMNPRVRAWRQQFYPEISDWTPYRNGTLPLPGQG